MLILSLDSCGPACAVCVWQDGVVLAQICEPMQRGQDARLIPIIISAMEKAGVGFAALDRIAITTGPGSFTGLRVGLAAAKGIGLASGKPVVGIDRFAVYHALHAHPGRSLLIVVESKRADLFCKFYPAGGASHEPCLMNAAEIDAFMKNHPDTMIAGDRHHPDDEVAAACATLAARADIDDPAFAPRPFYLRAPDAKVPSAMSRVTALKIQQRPTGFGVPMQIDNFADENRMVAAFVMGIGAAPRPA